MALVRGDSDRQDLEKRCWRPAGQTPSMEDIPRIKNISKIFCQNCYLLNDDGILCVRIGIGWHPLQICGQDKNDSNQVPILCSLHYSNFCCKSLEIIRCSNKIINPKWKARAHCTITIRLTISNYCWFTRKQWPCSRECRTGWTSLVKESNICTTLIFIADISHHRHHQRSCFGLLYPILAILACICVYYIFGVLFTSLFGVPNLTNIIFCKT